MSAQHWVTLSMVALAGSSLQGHISCWWLDTKWSVAILMAIIVGGRDLPTVGSFGASLQDSFQQHVEVGMGNPFPFWYPRMESQLVCVCVF